jgi:putative ABC transport system permease protein
MTQTNQVPEQQSVPWSTAIQTGIAGIRRRLGRTVVTMLGVVLAIALLSYMLVTNNLTASMVSLNDQALNALLQKSGVDILQTARHDPMTTMLIVLSLATCLVGIVNSMLMSVSERLKEIGTLKCLGATDAFIVRIYFVESMFVGVIGTACGMVGGLAVSLCVLGWVYGGYVLKCFPVAHVFGSLAVSFVVGVLISVLAAIAPAIWAARQAPVSAMRIEE